MDYTRSEGPEVEVKTVSCLLGLISKCVSELGPVFFLVSNLGVDW